MANHSKKTIEQSKICLAPLGKVSSRALFGGYSLAVEGTVFAMVSEGELYIRACEETASYTSEKKPAQLSFCKRGRSVSLNYFHVDESLWEESSTLLALSAYALADAQREKKRKSSVQRLKDLPNLTFQLEMQLCEVNITTVEKLRECGAQEAWLKLRQVNKHIGIRVLLALAGAIEGRHAATLLTQTREALYAWYQEIKNNKGRHSGK